MADERGPALLRSLSALRRSLPIHDRPGRLSRLRIFGLALCLAPALALSVRAASGALAPKPLAAALQATGEASVYLLLACLSVTPLRLAVRDNRLIGARRVLGVSALLYGIAHFLLYCAQRQWALATIASEIALRFYLTVGFASLCGLLALGATSSDGAVRKLGAARWQALHRLIYPAAVLALWHYALQSKNDATPAIAMTGFFLVLIGLRRLRRGSRLSARSVFAFALGLAPAVAGLEALWYGLASRVPVRDVLAMNFDFDAGVRPAWLAALLGLAFWALVAATDRAQPSRLARSAP